MLEILVAIFSLAAAVATVVPALLSLYKLIRSLSRRTALDELFRAMQSSRSIANQVEVNYQVKCYVQPKFLCGNKQCSVKELLKEIKKPGGRFAITGKPASGKTTAMRYLYCRLSRTRKCVYIQMQTVKSIEDLRECIKKQAAPKWKKDEPVTAFFDGVDEAISFRLDSSTSVGNSFFSLFLREESDPYNIHKMFRDCELALDSVVISFRPEFLDSKDRHSIQNLKMQVYQLEHLSDKDVIKVFKSLKVLQRMDKKDKKNQSDVMLRHNSRYPAVREERKYIKLLSKILKDNPDSIFYYPMFVRYAYPFMIEYEKSLGIMNLTPATNMAKSFKVLLRAALKWEFHIYYKPQSSSSTDKTDEFKKFEQAINGYMVQVIENMLEQDNSGDKNTRVISRDKLEKILSEHSYSDKDKLVIAHCIMTEDDGRLNFGFFHDTFYEFYLAKYLLLRADYPTRKRHLITNPSKYLQEMYDTILCDETDLCEKLSSSITDFEYEKLNIGNCRKLQLYPKVHVADAPKMQAVDILSYLPFLKSFIYRGIQFTQEQVEQMMSGILDLSQAPWNSLDYANALVPAQSIKTLKLQGMPLNDVQWLENCVNLSSLDIRLDASHEQAVYDSLRLLQNIPLKQLHVYTEDGRLCEDMQKQMDQGAVFPETILLDILEYSEAYVVIYRLKKKITASGRVFRFRIDFTDPDRAFEAYNKKDSLKNLEILTSVFELESEELAALSPQESRTETESVLWNGLSLAKFYESKDFVDENKDAYQIYKRLEPHVLAQDICEQIQTNQSSAPNDSHSNPDLKVRDAGSKTSVYFGEAYGKRLIWANKYHRARQWLTYTCQYADLYFSECRVIEAAIHLYRSRVRCHETDLDEFRNALQRRIERCPSFEENSDYFWFLRICCAELFVRWKKGEAPPEQLDSLSQMSVKKARAYAEQRSDEFTLFTAVYFRLIFENRMEHTEEAAKLLDVLAGIAPAADETCYDRCKQGYCIKYMEQRLYYLLLTKRREEAVKTANELIAYPYRTAELCIPRYQRIIDWCSQRHEKETSPVDKHELWECIWL